MNHAASRASLLRLADTYERIAAKFETRRLPCKVKGRDGTERDLEILCDTFHEAQEVYADFCGRGYLEVEIQDLHGNSIGKSGLQAK